MQFNIKVFEIFYNYLVSEIISFLYYVRGKYLN